MAGYIMNDNSADDSTNSALPGMFTLHCPGLTYGWAKTLS